MTEWQTRRHIKTAMRRAVFCQLRPFAPAPKPPHRLLNERRHAKEKLKRLFEMQERRPRDEAFFQKLQGLILPEKADSPVDRSALTAELRQLANLCDAQAQLETLSAPLDAQGLPSVPSRKKQRRDFRYTDYRTRFVALRVFYLGWDYQGFASQDTGKTIENALMRALKRTKLIPEDYAHSRDIQYSKCGRTDKGVSALGQIVSLVVRSRRKLHEDEASVAEEFDYPTMLNAVLPPEIRVWGWIPASHDFSARYSPISRSYKYFIVTSDRDELDIGLMQECCQKFLGMHNFQNFCKMNLDQTINHEREILEIHLDPITHIHFPHHSFFVLTLKGTAFLWHQVRCMMEVLLLIGAGLESPEILETLLNTNQTPAKPLYKPASEVPLVLWEADYGEQLEAFYCTDCQLQKNKQLLKNDLQEQLTKLLVMQHISEVLDATPHNGAPHSGRSRPYVPLLKRPCEPSFAERLEKHKQRNG